MLQVVASNAPIENRSNSASTSADVSLPTGVHLGDLLTSEFFARHSRFDSEDEMFAASGFKIECAQDFADIPDDDWDRFIKDNTVFETWWDMLMAARAEWYAKQT